MHLLDISDSQASHVPFGCGNRTVPQDPLEVVEVPPSPEVIGRHRVAKGVERGADTCDVKFAI